MASSKLAKVTVYGCVISVVGAALLSNRIHDNLERGEYYRKPVAMLRKYKPAVEAFGKPIRTSRMDLGDEEKNRVDGYIAKLAIPVRGPKDKGVLYVWASRDKPGESWDVTRLDLEINSDNSRRTFFQAENWVEFPLLKEKKS